MLEHPDISRVNLTGYPRLQTQPTIIRERCPQCHEEFTEPSEAITYADRYFCDMVCLVSWMIREGHADRTEVGGWVNS
ncbi:hypothetical protein [Paenibacillus apiarius]|uniref:hypothetical protein n=1 Tax=Paenibacillus apiarius TaxID=46240 RepID=UPI003B3A2EDE